MSEGLAARPSTRPTHCPSDRPITDCPILPATDRPQCDRSKKNGIPDHPGDRLAVRLTNQFLNYFGFPNKTAAAQFRASLAVYFRKIQFFHPSFIVLLCLLLPLKDSEKKRSKENNKTGEKFLFSKIYCEGNFKLCRDSFVRKFVHLYDQSDDWEVEGKGEGCRGKCRPSKGRSTVKVSGGGSGNRAISKLVGRWVGRSVSLSLGLSIGLTIGHTIGRSVGRAIGGTVVRSDGRSYSMSVCYSKGPLQGD